MHVRVKSVISTVLSQLDLVVSRGKRKGFWDQAFSIAALRLEFSARILCHKSIGAIKKIPLVLNANMTTNTNDKWY